eukprot:5124499-Amphidinium_carterae.1
MHRYAFEGLKCRMSRPCRCEAVVSVDTANNCVLRRPVLCRRYQGRHRMAQAQRCSSPTLARTRSSFCKCLIDALWGSAKTHSGFFFVL